MAERFDPGALSVPRRIRRYPGSVLVPGILFIALSATVVLMPQASTIAVNAIVGWILLLSGAVYAWSAFSMHGGWQIAGTGARAALSIVVGLLLLLNPLRGAITLTLVLGVFFLLGASVKFYGAIRNRHVRGWWWGGVSGVASLAILFSPDGRAPECGFLMFLSEWT